MRARRTYLSMTAAGLGLATALVPLASADAATVSCGSVITASTTLTTDLTCGPGDALTVGADNVTLDLGGHTITGPGAYGAGAGAGVRVTQRTGVTVTHGTITGFATGVVFNEATWGTASRLTLHHDDRGVELAGGGHHLVEKNTAYANGRDAVRLGLSADNRVTRNTVTGNVYGIGVADGSARNTVDRNVVSGNEQFGLAVFGAASATVLEKNQVSGTVYSGIQVSSDTTGTVLLQNYASGNGDDGIHVDATGATLTQNTAVYNADLGISAVTGVTDGGGNKASGNGNPAQCTGVSCNPAF